MLEEAIKLPALGFGSNEKERPFWVFSDETKASLVGTGDFRQRSSGGDAIEREFFILLKRGKGR